MIGLGQVSLLLALLACGGGSCLSYLSARGSRSWVRRGAVLSLAMALSALMVSIAVLAQTLFQRDFRFAYVAEYSHEQLPWHNSKRMTRPKFLAHTPTRHARARAR